MCFELVNSICYPDSSIQEGTWLGCSNARCSQLQFKGREICSETEQTLKAKLRQKQLALLVEMATSVCNRTDHNHSKSRHVYQFDI